eukprot:m.1211717 g.1211717  ORF g.1211717 m.1211717 type:complete len:99 (-) comp24594_c0_seq1:311-607(-)
MRIYHVRFSLGHCSCDHGVFGVLPVVAASPNADGSIARAIYPFGSFEPEIVKPDAYIEKACTAEEDWGMKGLPVRQHICPFILDEFGGITDTNTLGSM